VVKLSDGRGDAGPERRRRGNGTPMPNTERVVGILRDALPALPAATR
jgi:hypothetical protein